MSFLRISTNRQNKYFEYLCLKENTITAPFNFESDLFIDIFGVLGVKYSTTINFDEIKKLINEFKNKQFTLIDKLIERVKVSKNDEFYFYLIDEYSSSKSKFIISQIFLYGQGYSLDEILLQIKIDLEKVFMFTPQQFDKYKNDLIISRALDINLIESLKLNNLFNSEILISYLKEKNILNSVNIDDQNIILFILSLKKANSFINKDKFDKYLELLSANTTVEEILNNIRTPSNEILEDSLKFIKENQGKVKLFLLERFFNLINNLILINQFKPKDIFDLLDHVQKNLAEIDTNLILELDSNKYFQITNIEIPAESVFSNQIVLISFLERVETILQKNLIKDLQIINGNRYEISADNLNKISLQLGESYSNLLKYLASKFSLRAEDLNVKILDLMQKDSGDFYIYEIISTTLKLLPFFGKFQIVKTDLSVEIF